MPSAAPGHRIVTIVLAITIVLLVVAVAVLAYFYVDKTPFSKDGVLDTFNDCGNCESCLTCLSRYNDENLVETCQTLTNIFQCVQQIIYNYGMGYDHQPCYDECQPCAECLEGSTFDGLAKLDQTLWEEEFGELFHSPEDVGHHNYTATFDEETQKWSFKFPDLRDTESRDDQCCDTSSMQLPYKQSNEVGGKTWYPVWFYFPSRPLKHELQWHYSITCSPSNGCDTQRLQFSYLMTTKPPSAKYGYTYKILTLPSKNVRFIYVYMPAYCQNIA